MDSRIEAARAEMIRRGADAYLLLTRANKFYFTGFDHYTADAGNVSFLFITRNNAYFAVEKMEKTAALEYAQGCTVIAAESGDDIGKVIARIADAEIAEAEAGADADRHFTNIAYEKEALRYQDYIDIREALCDVLLVPEDIAGRMREVKGADEIADIERAMRMADEALAAVIPRIRTGMTEKEVAWALESTARADIGADDLSFPVIVASGLNSAKPHHMPSDKKLGHGDFVTIDFGVRYKGYMSDTTRTFVMGAASEKQREVYGVVLEALLTATKKAAVGMTGKELDDICRSVITERGYGEYFTHSTGHSVGLDIHEPPWIAKRGDTGLEANTVFTIEPGIYIEGFGGVRIEDSVVLTKDGARVLTGIPRELTVL
jgi:Xaa-Pro aminopeptidase